MTRSDLDINCDIRRVLVRHWIDLGKIFFRSTSGRVSMRGSLQRIAGVREEITSAVIDGMLGDLNRIGGVVNVYAEFDNWNQSLGRWRPVERNKNRTIPTLSKPQTEIQDISDKN